MLLAPYLGLCEATHNVTKFSYKKVIVCVISSGLSLCEATHNVTKFSYQKIIVCVISS